MYQTELEHNLCLWEIRLPSSMIKHTRLCWASIRFGPPPCIACSLLRSILLCTSASTVIDIGLTTCLTLVSILCDTNGRLIDQFLQKTFLANLVASPIFWIGWNWPYKVYKSWPSAKKMIIWYNRIQFRSYTYTVVRTHMSTTRKPLIEF